MFKNFFFDYFFYRLYQWNSNDDFKEIPPVVVISGIQSLFMVGITLLPLASVVERSVYAPYSKAIGLSAGMLMLVLIYTNYKKYKHRFVDFDRRWSGEAHHDRIFKASLMILTIILSFVPALIAGIFL